MSDITPPDTSDTKAPDTKPADQPGASSGAPTKVYLIGFGVVVAILIAIAILNH
jgi:hypothetical protein